MDEHHRDALFRRADPDLMTAPAPRARGAGLRGAALAATAAGLLIGAALTTALGRAERPRPPSGGPGRLAEVVSSRSPGGQRPRAIARPADLSPFGPGPGPAAPGLRQRPGLVETPLGLVDLKVTAPPLGVPRDLLAPAAALRAVPGKGQVGEGVSLVQIDAAALAARGFEAVEEEVRRFGDLLGVVPERALVVRFKDREAGLRLAAEPMVEAVGAYHPAYKISPLVGRIPLMQASRAASRVLELEISLWQGADAASARAALEEAVGRDNVAVYSLDGTVFLVRAAPEQVGRVAHIPGVAGIAERTEYALADAEVPTLMMLGSYEEGFNGARPYHDVGVDGGGIDTGTQGGSPTTPDGQRLNDGSDAVPPQIVAVTDNGISYDSLGFSQTVTRPDTLQNPIGPAHRKVHSIQVVEDNGTTCDAALSGGHTHGNVVAGVIAANPPSFGFVYSKQVGSRLDGLPPESLSLQSLARGARIIMQDAANPTRCTFREPVEVGGNVNPGRLLDRLAQAICPKSGGTTGACAGITGGGGGEVHLHVMPFGVPRFENIFNPSNGTYPLASRDLDLFLVNNRDYMVFSPVGNQGADAGGAHLPDLFDCTIDDDDPNLPDPLQISPPATAKNTVTIGATLADAWTALGGANAEEMVVAFSSKGPATAASLRTAPLLVAVGDDGSGLDGFPLFRSAMALRSRDNDNLFPVESEVDEGNSGTSYASAFATAAGAIVRDYFAQGLYPTAGRVDADRMPQVSGHLVRAALVAGANFAEELATRGADTPAELLVASSRGVNLTTGCVSPGVIGNGIQGYGRIVLDQVLPLSNYPPTRGLGAPDTIEYPAAGLLVWDMLGTGEPPIDNGGNVLTERSFIVDGVNARALEGGTRVIEAGQLRVALSWPDPPSLENSGGTLINDLDLEVESPGPDNDIATVSDNRVYDGNVYIAGRGVKAGQWSQERSAVAPAVHDRRNTVEAAHLSSFVDAATPNQLVTGTWKVRVMRGQGGAAAGQITMINGPDEDANRNGRIDPGEDADVDGLLDAGGQPFALVVAGPVLGTGSQSWGGAQHALPGSLARLDRYQYGCADVVTAEVLDPDSTADGVSAATIIRALTPAGLVGDEERLAFTESFPGSRAFRSAPLPARQASVSGQPFASPGGVRQNGILEGTTGWTIEVLYADAPRPAAARARFQCDPNVIQSLIDVPGAADAPVFIGGGCDGDRNLDRDERLTYSVALRNFERSDDLTEVTATLTPTGPGAAAVRVLDSPKRIGRVPGGQATGVTFSLFIDPVLVDTITNLANRRVDLELRLDGVAGGVSLSGVTYTFSHVLASDDEALHYSTDFPAGGRELRDLNRSLQIDRADRLDPFRQVLFPDEDVTFSTMFVPGTDSGMVANTLGEDLNNNNVLDVGEDLLPNGMLDRGIVAQASGPSSLDKVPWNFDRDSGGWQPFRFPFSRPGTSAGPNPVWERVGSGICGFQTTIPDSDPSQFFQNNGAGIWHTGDGDPRTPTTSAFACDNFTWPNESGTPPGTEFYYDVLHSPILAKVHQALDARAFPFTVEFQRLGFNLNIQIPYSAGGTVDLDNDATSDRDNCLICASGFESPLVPDAYALAVLNPGYGGVEPFSDVAQRTFGPLTNDDAFFFLSGDETGFTGFTDNTNPNSGSPIPTAPPDLLPFPAPGGPQVCLPGCTNPLQCCEQNTTAGPVRNFDIILTDWADGIIHLGLDAGSGEARGGFRPGPTGNRWLIGFGFVARETAEFDTDYGIGIDDVVLEWDEVHPVDETAAPPLGLGRIAACSRFGGPGQPAGQQCATLTVDRLTLYECNTTVEVTVNDPRRAAQTKVTVFAVTESDGVPVTSGGAVAQHPRKSFLLPAVQGSPGLFRAGITIGTLFDAPGLVFTRPIEDAHLTFYYLDPECDGDRDGMAGENDFRNLDGDGVGAADNCPDLYNPAQEDGDADGSGDLCDNCPGRPNPDQRDTDMDGVADPCDLDDVDFDGALDGVDNCPDVYNPLQTWGQGGRGAACDRANDRDGDGDDDRADNCVRTFNPTQADTDRDGIGDGCDGDCRGARSQDLEIGSCSRSSAVECSRAVPSCPTTGTCLQAPWAVCDSSTPQCSCVNIAPETCELLGVVNDGACSTADDDFDLDTVADPLDTCPVLLNPPRIPGTARQDDADSDGRGDACDPPQALDDDGNAVPDDAIGFNAALSCDSLPLPRLTLLGTRVRDTNGDRDRFADAGEIARLSVVVRNEGPLDLSGAVLLLGGDDPDIACITKGSVSLGAFPAGATIDTEALGDPAGEFEFIVSAATATVDPLDPASATFVLSLISHEAIGLGEPVTTGLALDLDLPGGTLPAPVHGPDGLPGTADDGVVFESFDTDRDGDGVVTLCSGLPGDPGTTGDTIGTCVGTAPGGAEALAAIGCGGFQVPPEDPECRIDPDNEFDWHIHCPAGSCPNRTGHVTPLDGERAFSGRNSLHWGYHFLSDTSGDTVKFRQLAAFVSLPINLAPLADPGSLQLSFFQIASMMDNNNVNLPPSQAVDFGDVQIQFDLDTDPSIDRWGFWDKLVPYQNVYDHTAYVWSAFGLAPTYCLLTPTDTGTAPPAPRGVHETLCYPMGVWSHCGNLREAGATYQCPGPGFAGTRGAGLWVETRFDLAAYAGRRVRIRWIAQSWEFNCCSYSYYELGGSWGETIGDEGWWVDDIRITGALQSQATPVPDPDPPATGACPGRACDPAQGDNGFDLSLRLTESQDDGIVVAGEPIILSASGTTVPGGCIGGLVQFRFFKDGVMRQDWSSDPTLADQPERDARYAVQARCTAEPACESSGSGPGSTLLVLVYTGDGGDVILSVRPDGPGGAPTLEWASRPQPPAVTGYDVYSGSIAAAGDTATRSLSGSSCLAGDVPQPAGAPGPPVSVPVPVTPALGTAAYYLVGHSPSAPGAVAALGRRSDGSIRIPPSACP